MGVAHRGSKERRELRVHTLSKLPYPPRCRQQGAHQPPKAKAGRRGSRQREELKSRRRPQPGLSFPLAIFVMTVLQEALAVPLSSDQDLGIVWSLPQGTIASIDTIKGGGWGGGGNNSIEFWVIPMRTQLVHKLQTPLNPQLSQGLKEALSFLIHGVTVLELERP